LDAKEVLDKDVGVSAIEAPSDKNGELSVEEAIDLGVVEIIKSSLFLKLALGVSSGKESSDNEGEEPSTAGGVTTFFSSGKERLKSEKESERFSRKGCFFTGSPGNVCLSTAKSEPTLHKIKLLKSSMVIILQTNFLSLLKL
jgi:hypothetical protein